MRKIETVYRDTITYNDKEYFYLETNTDIFTYFYNSNSYYEEDMIHKIPHNKWDLVFLEGDLFITEEQLSEAIDYYSNDRNYTWFVTTEYNDTEIIFPIDINEKELKYIYNMDNMKKKETMTFDDIEQFANITKISKDQTMFAVISLAKYKNNWYWKTEIMDDNDREYIIKLPSSLNQKIEDSLN
jgi:hypothetical protein